MSISFGGAPTMQQIVDAILSDDPPPSEAVAADPGTMPKARRGDARTKRLTSSTYNSVGLAGLTTVIFTRGFTKRPAIDCLLIEANDNGPYCFTARRYLKNTGTDVAPVWATWTDADLGVAEITAVELYGYRIRSLPTLNLGGIVLIGPLLTALGILSGYTPYEALATGTKFTTIALASSEP